MKRIVLFLLMAMAVNAAAWAGYRSEQEANQLAAQYFTSRGNALRASYTSNTTLQCVWTAMQSDNTPAFYVFNRGKNDGFIIISAEDRTRTVLAYADEGHFDATNIPVNTRKWLEGYSRGIAYAADLPARPNRIASLRRATKSYVPVDVLCATRWNQGAPYNLQCPMKNGEQTVTGCVATAAAQIMKFHNYPTQGVGSHSYDWNGTTLSADFGNTTYQWSLMENVYTNASSSASKNAVATLMSHCGIACDMTYGVSSEGGSWAYFSYMLHGMIDYFDYDQGIRMLYKKYMGEEAFLDSVSADLQQGHPVYFSGQTVQGGGHAFICDGMDSNGLVHINWGWGGNCDAYYQVSVMDPEDQGIGGSSGNYAYTEDVEVYTHIRPNAGGRKAYTFSCSQMNLQLQRFARSTKAYFIADTMQNVSLFQWAGYPALQVYKDGQLYDTYVDKSGSWSLNPYYYYYHVSIRPSLSAVPEGEYEVVPSIAITEQPGVYEPIYLSGHGECRYSMIVTADSIFIGVTPDVPTGEGLDYDAEDADFTENFDTYELSETFATSGYGWLKASNESNGAEVQLLVILPNGAITLTAGTYGVDTVAYYQSIYAGRGVSDAGYIQGSFAGYRNSNGNFSSPLWFVVSGSMVVGNDGVIQLNARNSYNRAIRCRIGSSQQAIDEVKPAQGGARKQLREGQLLLTMPDGRTYDAVGRRKE